MDRFRVYCMEEQSLYYTGYLLDQEGNLFEINKKNDGLLVKCTKENYIIMHGIERQDICGREIYERDILRYESGFEFIVDFGLCPAFCPGDRLDTTNQGFVAVRLADKMISDELYPLSSVESLAKVIGTYLNEKLLYYPQLDNNDKWFCPHCGNIISSIESNCEKHYICDCCGVEFDKTEWSNEIINNLKNQI